MICSWQDMQRLVYHDNYHCEHFLIDAYRFLTGIDLTNKLLLSGFFHVKNLRKFKKIDHAQQHCIVFMRDKNKAHVGVWHNNQVLHLGNNGVVLQSLTVAKQGFKRVNFYAVN